MCKIKKIWSPYVAWPKKCCGRLQLQLTVAAGNRQSKKSGHLVYPSYDLTWASKIVVACCHMAASSRNKLWQQMAAKCANIQSDNPRPPPPLNCQSDNINHSKKCGGLLPQQTVYFQETTKLSKLKNVVTLDHNESSLVFF